MIYTIYANRDATIYEKTESLNSGIDAVLELSHEAFGRNPVIYNSRVLMQFNLIQLKEYLVNGKIPYSAKYFLELKTVDVQEIPQEYTINAYPVSESWTNGTGNKANRPTTTDGVSWKYRSSKNIGVEWNVTQSINPDVVGEYNTNYGGGTWWDTNNLVASQSFTYQTSDVYMDVTNIVNSWVSGSTTIPNEGFIVKFNEDVENLADSTNTIKFFSTDSNTIYVPKLHIVWDNSEFVTGSLDLVNLDNMNLNVKLKKYYANAERAKIRIYANTRYPLKTYTTESYYTVNYYLPSSSYYEIRDAHTDEIYIPFSKEGTKISCDGESSYFDLWMHSFQPERFYRVVIKVETDDGDNIQIFDNNHYFKVTR
jgi:hypothetical protein